MAIQAIFFDFDGVLADSMPYHLPAWNQVLEKDYGFSLDPMVVKLNEGRPVYEIAQAVFAAAGQTGTPDILNAVIAKKNALFRASHRATIFSENFEIIRRAKEQGLVIGLVTGTKRENISYIIPDELLTQFDVIIADGDAPRGKPSPDPYLLAAEKTAVAPKDCLVIENAPAGIQAAKAAGMFCVALKTTLPAEHLKQADVTFSNHAELLRAWAKFI